MTEVTARDFAFLLYGFGIGFICFSFQSGIGMISSGFTDYLVGATVINFFVGCITIVAARLFIKKCERSEIEDLLKIPEKVKR